MPEILTLMTPLFPGSINGENLPKRVKRKGATLTVAGKKQKQSKTKNCSILGLIFRQL
jgi:hypothetical protein